MNLKEELKNKFDKGISTMSEESEYFVALLREFNQDNGLKTEEVLSHGYLLPEGANWLLRLKNGKDVLVDRCSYQVRNDDIDYIWVDFDLNSKNVIVEINKKDKSKADHILLSGDEVIEFYP